MIQYDMILELSQNSFDRIEEIIEYHPDSLDVAVSRFQYHSQYVPANPETNTDGDPYGYEVSGRKNRPISKPKDEDVFVFNTKCLIVSTPSRSFIKKVGIFWDESKSETMPVIGFFKNKDEIQREDIIKIIIHDTGINRVDTSINRKFKVVDILTKGSVYSFMKIYHLAPYRDTL
jgi:hypothetical protein